ncbi:hypothetical protein BT96DRAFT_993431 [Gymnopus androsaceus JB14]|uniref:choline-phosphate cytidylyltransferase n=1 Tax=Gymnopus androsaceus JB14 TaxID=1447944 RepID=A0A6A4HTC0_9AGAR|nr:hypothetical protein BT96DRAFT_993431 [Gymnopus androsaceus JB14]
MFGPATTEPPPTPEAYDKFATVRLSATDIQTCARTSLGLAPAGKILDNRTRRIYVDGLFDIFNVGHALQLRQAKLSFPSVHLIIGVFSDQLCEAYGTPTAIPHLERCELVRHCRWVDQVLPDAPNIDYVVLDEGATVDPACDKVRLKGYDAMKRIGKVILTKRTMGLTLVTPATSTPTAPPSPTTPTSPAQEEIPEPLVEF